MALVPTRFETAANWLSSNPVLANNEVGIETDTGYVKTGDGVRRWVSLPKTDDQETSAQKAAKTSDESGTGAQVYATSPTLVTATLTTPTVSSPTISGFIVHTSTNAITASSTQTQLAATALTSKINRVVTVASANNAVKLPAATAGKEVTVINAHASNAIGVFPASGDTINALSQDAVYAMAAAKTAMFFCAVAGTWNSILTA